MMIKSQKDAFLTYEADAWYRRNKNVEYVRENDVVIKVLKEYSVSPHDVLEIGCSTGYRLDAIAESFRPLHVTGLDPSAAALSHGREKYPNINFVHGTADDMSAFKTSSFDLVIIGFVLYVVDRDILFKVIAETDRLLKNGGILMIIDFFCEKPTRNAYQHITDIEAYAFKQNYDEIFTASRLYHLLDKRSMNHASKGYDLGDDFYNKYSLTTMRKDLSVAYK